MAERFPSGYALDDLIRQEETPDERAYWEELAPGADEFHSATARHKLVSRITTAMELFVADRECEHGRLPTDSTPECGCWEEAA